MLEKTETGKYREYSCKRPLVAFEGTGPVVGVLPDLRMVGRIGLLESNG